MNLTIRLLGREVLAIETGTETCCEPGDATSYPVAFGFTPADDDYEETDDE